MLNLCLHLVKTPFYTALYASTLLPKAIVGHWNKCIFTGHFILRDSFFDK